MPWIEVHIPLLNLPSLSGINGGLFSWPLLLLFIVSMGLLVYERPLVQRWSGLRPWLYAAPLVVGALFVMRAFDVITIAVAISNALQGFSYGINMTFITPGAGGFLMLLGGLLLLIGGSLRLADAWQAAPLQHS
ncbi:hypothetical protein [Thermogemmatispora sp.]|uniref:hypothetical protein n=1 Tax=Thermogemmatispora sp. TaxID=1968838 RepID=UPI002ACC1BB0|nr:hypothetical protein [Thermogemmatispora sp.]